MHDLRAQRIGRQLLQQRFRVEQRAGPAFRLVQLLARQNSRT
jgi:hypothetical protein